MFVVPLLAGCYEYKVIDPSAAAVGSDVRARVSGATSDRIAPLLGVGDARLLTGSVVQTNADGTLIVEVSTAAQPGPGGTIQSFAQHIALAKGDILELESRTLDPLRTGALVAGAVVVAGASAAAALHGSPGRENAPSGTGTELRIPVLRLHF